MKEQPLIDRVPALVRATQREERLTMAFVTWTTVGLFVDAYYHSTDPGLESFWTPWHALFYSGFLATAAWLLRMTMQRLRPHTSVFDAPPFGYRAAVVGIGIFALGGIGDAVWHTVFGVETSLDALLSPTHLLLFVGLLMISSAPFRAAFFDPKDDSASDWRGFAAPLFSLTWSTTLVAFFVSFAYLLNNTELPRIPYSPETGDGEFVAAFGFLAVLITTVLIVLPVLIMVRRWAAIPVGAITTLLVVMTLALAIGFDDDLIGIPAVIAGGVAAELLVVAASSRWVAAAVPMTTWVTYFVIVGRLSGGLGWPPEIWGGMIFFSVLTGLGIDAVMRLAPLRADARQSVEAAR